MDNNIEPVRPGGDPEPDKEKEEKKQRKQTLTTFGYIAAAVVGLVLFQLLLRNPVSEPTQEIPYSEFRQKLDDGEVTSVEIGDERITGFVDNPDPGKNPDQVYFFTSVIPASDPTLVEDLQAAGIEYSFKRQPSQASSLLLSWGVPILLMLVVWYFLMKRMGSPGGSGMGSIFGVSKSKATEVKPEEVGITYQDVGGADEAIAELQEITEFLKSPERFAKLGGRIPKGVLLVGSPGTGKTLLAKATAGEANVPFFQTSGSEFIELYVGVGAARVRDLFDQARKSAPAIVFIDEIDAIGQSRGGAMRPGTNDEREQTLNQLLAEIDGFKTGTSAPVIIMAATNRPEILDPALMRAGRFDRQVVVDNPDLIGREQILQIHSRNIKLSEEFNMKRAARITAGFSGADLENVMNEAALLAARRDADTVTTDDFEEAIERVVAGLEKRTRVMSDEVKSQVAYHEIGHALVAELVPYADPVSKISIIPRTRGALGYTLQMPTEDRYLLTKEELLDRIAVFMGGRAAEQYKFGTISTGASDDIQRATGLAKRMVTEFGMSEQLGSVRYAGQGMQYLESMGMNGNSHSPKTSEMIDVEIQNIVTGQYQRAQRLLKKHRRALEKLTYMLLEQESIDGCEVVEALNRNRDCER